MCVTIGRLPVPIRPRCSTVTHRIARASIHAPICDFRGILQADGYAGYAGLYGNRIVEAACMAHARRKLFDVHETTKSPLAREALDRIAALYRIEATIRGGPPEQRLRVRTERTAPLMAELKGLPTRGRASQIYRAG